MIGNQRWRARRDSYRRPDEVIETRLYEVAPIADDVTAKRFVVEHHYSGCYPAARERFGLYRGGRLVGVAVFSHPCRDVVLTSAFPAIHPLEAVELGRFVLLDDVPGNGETWFLARCFSGLRGRFRGVVSFSDPVQRTDARGRAVFVGHLGTIYQAFNGVYRGRGKPRLIRLLPDGSVFSDRAISKIRSLDRGWRYSVEQLERFGAARFGGGDAADAAAWLKRELPRVTRPLRHGGNHRYAWALDRHLRKSLASQAQCYPKRAPIEVTRGA